MRRDGVDLENLLITVRGKGHKQRIVPISFELRKTLYRWLMRRTFPLVFPTRRGSRTGRRNNLREFKALGAKPGIVGVRVSFHTLTHTFAVNHLRAGGNAFDLQRILGHSALETTNRYVRSPGVEDLQAVHRRLSVLARA